MFLERFNWSEKSTLIVGANIPWAGALGWRKGRKISLCVHLCLPSNHEYNRPASSCSCLHGFPAVMDHIHLWTQVILPSLHTSPGILSQPTKKLVQGNRCRYACAMILWFGDSACSMCYGFQWLWEVTSLCLTYSLLCLDRLGYLVCWNETFL